MSEFSRLRGNEGYGACDDEAQRNRPDGRKEFAMLSLNLKDGEYLTIGEDIVIQVFTNSTIKLAIQAPKEMTVLRGEVLERNGEERPDCVYDPKSVKKDKSGPKSKSYGTLKTL